MSTSAKRLIIFASGSGSNAEQIIQYFKGNAQIEIAGIVTNKKEAFVIERAKRLQIPCQYFSRQDFYETENVLNYLKEKQIDYIILAGFLWKVPDNILHAFGEKQIINIHPALLPKYGGKGMYGAHVHHAVVENKETESGITIHFVNEHYDEGEIIFQARCAVLPTDTPDSLADKIHTLEHKFFPKVIENVVLESKI